jgi:SAM-dependent methyltransferase
MSVKTQSEYQYRVPRGEILNISQNWQLNLEAAELYEAIPVPTILGPAARLLVEHASINSDSNVIDVGCGTGAATRYVAKIVSSPGSVTGVDINAGMIEVAKSLPNGSGMSVDWYECSAFELPFEENTFNVAISAQTIQFLDDRARALSEMSRVLKPDGQLAISTWCSIEKNPYFDALVKVVSKFLGAETASGLEAAFTLTSSSEVKVVSKFLGAETASGLEAAFTLTSSSEIAKLLTHAGLKNSTVDAFEINLDLPPIEDFVARHISATPMAGSFSAAPESMQQDLAKEVAKSLERYKTEAGATVPFQINVGKATAE